jgi:hypothetical protein
MTAIGHDSLQLGAQPADRGGQVENVAGQPVEGKMAAEPRDGAVAAGQSCCCADDAVVVESWSRMSSTLLLLLVSRSSSPVYS